MLKLRKCWRKIWGNKIGFLVVWCHEHDEIYHSVMTKFEYWIWKQIFNYLHDLQGRRKVWKSGGASIICPPVEIWLTDLPKSGGDMALPTPPVTKPLSHMSIKWTITKYQKVVLSRILTLLCENIRVLWIKYREKISNCHNFVLKGHLEVCRIIKESECLCTV